MPVSVKDFWEKLQGDADDRLVVTATSITADTKGELVNSINENGESLLLYVLSNEECWELLDPIANHPRFSSINFAPDESPGSNAIHEILTNGNAEILKKFIRKKEIIFNCSELSWVEAHQNVAIISKMYQKQFTKNPNSATTRGAAEQLDNAKLMRTMLRDATSREAVRIWDAAVSPALLQGIDAQGFLLSYKKASLYIDALRADYAAKKAQNENSPASKAAFGQLENAKLMRTLFRDTNLEQAVGTWHVAVPVVTTTMLKDLELEGIDLSRVGNEEEQGFIWSFIKARVYVAKLELDFKTKNDKNPNSVETKAAFSQLENAKLLRTLFRDKVIEEAVERNKSSILDGLEAAGDRVGFLTKDKETYHTLAIKDEKNPKTDIIEWHKERGKASAVQLSQAEAAFHNKLLVKRIAEEKLSECTKAYYEKINTAIAGSGEHTTAVTRAAFGVG